MLILSYRFTDMFPDVDHIRDMQKELDEIIQIGVYNIVKLLKNSETMTSSGVADNEDEFEIQNKSQISKFTVPALSTDDVDDEITKKPPQQKQQQKATLSARFQSAKASKDESDMEKKTRLGKIDLKPGQRVSEQLIKHGLLTKNLLKKLQEELANDARKDFEDDEKNWRCVYQIDFNIYVVGKEYIGPFVYSNLVVIMSIGYYLHSIIIISNTDVRFLERESIFIWQVFVIISSIFDDYIRFVFCTLAMTSI